MSGAPVPVSRPSKEPTVDDVRRAASTVSVMIFQLWATGTLVKGRGDDELIRLAQPFLANPRGISAGEPGRTPHPDHPEWEGDSLSDVTRRPALASGGDPPD